MAGGKIVNAPYNQGFSYSVPRPTSRTLKGVENCTGTECSPLLTTSGTANTEVIGFINIDARNATNLPRLARIGSTFSKFRLQSLTAQYKGVVAATTSGEFAMALIYDAADAVAANWTIQRILQTYNARDCSIWGVTDPLHYDAKHAAKPWYISGTTTGVGAQNEQTPVTIVYGFYSNSTNIPAGRIRIDYNIKFVEPIAPDANT